MKKYILSMLLIAVVCSVVLYSCGGDKKETPAPDSSPKTGTFTDSRDGRVYKTVTISGQTWMAENLQYVGTSANEDTSYCYGTNTDRFYDALAANKACPAGWHLSSDKEWQLLEHDLGMTNSDTSLEGNSTKRGVAQAIGIKLANGGSSGFNALMTGNTIVGPGTFSGFWTSTSRSGVIFARKLNKSDSSIYRFVDTYSSYRCVRCIKN